MNRRIAKRKRLRIPVSLEPGKMISFTRDVSSGGVFLVSARVHPPGTRVRLVFRTPGGPRYADGVVSWAKRVPTQLLQHAKGGMGITFTSISPELEAYLDVHLSVPAVTARAL